MKFTIFTLTSPIHDPEAIDRNAQAFLDQIAAQTPCVFELTDDFTRYDEAQMPLIFVRTGGTEGLFRKVLPHVKGYVRLLTSGMNNSLAASMEILSFLQQNGMKGEILHGSIPYIASHLRLEYHIVEAQQRLNGKNIGIIGAPSDWLIASEVDRKAVLQKLGIRCIDITIEELVEAYHAIDCESRQWQDLMANVVVKDFDSKATEHLRPYRNGAFKIYLALKHLIDKYELSGFTLRCFDLLGLLHNTGCMALAMFNEQGIPACCEGDVPTLLTMMIGHALTDCAGFQANPSRIDSSKSQITFAHCTVPFDMIQGHSYHTHFESGIGIAIRGQLRTGCVTIAKVSGDLSRAHFQQATLIDNLSEGNLCRTQIVLQGESFADYFLQTPIGNHHVIFEGDQTELFRTFMKRLA